MVRCYTCNECDETFDMTVKANESLTHHECPQCNKPAARDYVAEHKGFAHHPGVWPQHNDVAGVHPDQRKEAHEASVRAGVPTDFDSEGCAIFRSAKHARDYGIKMGFRK